MRKALRMNFETIMSFVGVVVAPLVAFIFRELSATKKELADYKKEVAEKYASKEEFVRIEDKIDNLTRLVMDRFPKRGK